MKIVLDRKGKLDAMCEKINSSQIIWRAHRRGFMSKNMSVYCETMALKQKGALTAINIDFWDSGRVNIDCRREWELDSVKAAAKIIEKYLKMKVTITMVTL